MRILTWPCLLLLSLPFIHGPSSVYAACEFSVFNRGSLYNFSLTWPSPKYPHGVLSEDGFYKASGNGTLLWFQPCDQMVFNHDPPRCFDCQGCGSPSRCGMECSALVANNLGGYLVCTAAGEAFDPDISLIDSKTHIDWQQMISHNLEFKFDEGSKRKATNLRAITQSVDYHYDLLRN